MVLDGLHWNVQSRQTMIGAAKDFMPGHRLMQGSLKERGIDRTFNEEGGLSVKGRVPLLQSPQATLFR